ncbi:hypothetical protein ACEWY4_020848 [Coilia grayii]|uniref:Chemokine interleukin-8-like domain-containing protein n=1 Tax=Coilia grayii TaxID=363190 RepID=A0ABD1J7A4_9TELE
MVLKTGLATLLLLFLQGLWTQWTERGVCATAVPVRCVCVRELQSVRWRDITHVAIVPDTPLCRRHLIITLKSKTKVCLNPNSEQGNRLQDCWPKVKRAKARKTACLRPAKPNKAKGTSRQDYTAQ